MENNSVGPQNVKESSQDPTTLILGIYSRKLKTYGHTETCVWMFTVPLLIKSNAHQLMKEVYSYNGILFGDTKERKTYICCTTWMNLENIVKWKKLVTKDHVLYDSIDMKCPERQTYRKEKQISCLRLEEVGGGNDEWLLMGTGFLLGSWQCSVISL